MPFQVIETKDLRAKDGSLTKRIEFFDFGCRRAGHTKLGELYYINEGKWSGWSVRVVFGGLIHHHPFSSRSEAVDFIESSLSSKESFISTIINLEQNCKYNTRSFRFMSKFLTEPSSTNLSFKRLEIRNFNGWEIFDESTGTKLGVIQREYDRHPYKLVLAFKYTTSQREITKGKIEYRREIASFDSKKEAVSYAKKIIAVLDFDVEDLLYMSRWKECMADMENFEWL